MSEVVGQEQIVSALEKSLESNKLHHAYLFSGARGTGKTSVARILAHAANEFEYKLEAVHPDIIEIDAASNTGVDNIRELIERAVLAPTSGKYKIYIIDEVHMLSKSAFNALLKTLEEPPGSVIFILATTDPEKVPITILSRVQHFKFDLADTTVLAAHLRKIADQEKFSISDSALAFLAEGANGSFRDALSLLEQANAVCGGEKEIAREDLESAFGVPSSNNISDLVKAFDSGDTGLIIDILDKVCYNQGGNIKSFIEGLARQILRTPNAKTLSLLDELINILKKPVIDPTLQIRLVFLKHTPQMQASQASRLYSNETARALAPPSAGADSPRIVVAEPGGSLAEIESPSEPASEPGLKTDKLEDKQNGSTTTDASDTETERPAAGGSSALSWDEVLSTIKQSDIGLWAVLAKRQVKISDEEVIIYAEKPLWAGKLENADNFAKISRLIVPKTLVITTEKAPPSETAKKVSAILGVDAGDLKEVEVPDGI